MHKLVLSIFSVTAFATLSSPAQAHEHCDQPRYGYRQSSNYDQPPVRIDRDERHDYYRFSENGCRRSYREHRYQPQGNDDDHRCETPSHHGLRGFIERLIR